MFIQRWYHNCAGLDEQQAEKSATKLRQAIFNLPALRDLTKRPLLLTLVAFLHSNRYDLPDQRADLYERLLELLIEKWEKARFKVIDAEEAFQREQYSLAEYLQVGVGAIRLVLERLAYQAHSLQSEQNGTADIAAKELSHQLMCLAKTSTEQSEHKIDPLAIGEYLRDRVGILYQRGGKNDLDAVYTFPHRSFQEYLAACYFRRDEKSFSDQYQDFNCEEWWEYAAHLAKTDPDRWREVVVLVGGIDSYKAPVPVWSLLNALVPDTQNWTKEAFWGLRLAAEILVENLKRDELKHSHQKILQRIRNKLPKLLTTTKLNANERVVAGKYLAKMGDSRQQVLSVDHIGFCQVADGDFFLGGEKKQSLSYSYAISRYPITVAQFREFIEQTDYQPTDSDCLLGLNNAPVVYVSWNDAIAFCDWLTSRWKSKGWLDEGWRVDLPSEPEWEKAARGGIKIPVVVNNQLVPQELMETMTVQPQLTVNDLAQRLYPWGNEINQEHLNFSMNIGTVSTLGCYPLGKSPYGCEEMSGNVWEWTRSLYKSKYSETEDLWQKCNIRTQDGRYVLRGGAFRHYQHSVRCSARFDYSPDDRNHLFGFRVVLSPFL